MSGKDYREIFTKCQVQDCKSVSRLTICDTCQKWKLDHAFCDEHFSVCRVCDKSHCNKHIQVIKAKYVNENDDEFIHKYLCINDSSDLKPEWFQDMND